MCFESVGEYGMELLGSHLHPEVTLDCIPMGRSMDAWASGEYASIREILAESIARLAAAGADFFVCPDNTAHLALEHPGPDLRLPGLHIADVVASAAASAGHRRLGILGTRWTMESDLYPRALARYGLSAVVPDEDDRADVQQITFDELVHGVFTDVARQRFVDIISSLQDRGCDAVALVCTEFPLLVSPDVSPLPTLASTTLAARAAVDLAVGDQPLPTWRGGVVRSE